MTFERKFISPEISFFLFWTLERDQRIFLGKTEKFHAMVVK